MSVEDSRHTTMLQDAFLEAGKLLGYPSGIDQNAESQYGFSKFQFNIKNGERWTSADAYLRPIIENQPYHNLNILINTKVLRILFKKNRAVGVEINRNGQFSQLFCRKEIILSAGVLGSPQLLMLSGIGPRDHLKELNIPVLKNLPGVGRNLQDHIASYGLTWITNLKGVAYNPFLYTVNPNTYLQWKLYKTGPLAAPIGVDGNAFLASKYANKSWPDLQLTFLASHPGFDGGTIYKEFLGLSENIYNSYFSQVAFKEGFTIYPILNRPKSRGSVKLTSSNPSDPLSIDPNYLENPMDIEVLIEGMKLALEIGNASPFKDLGFKLLDIKFPGCEEFNGDSYWECWIRHLATTDHHPVGTCKMGNDPLSVVDQDLKVRGFKGLRIVDASIFPTIPSGNINIPIIMVAEKIADTILKN